MRPRGLDGLVDRKESTRVMTRSPDSLVFSAAGQPAEEKRDDKACRRPIHRPGDSVPFSLHCEFPVRMRIAMARPVGVVRSRAQVSDTKPTPSCASSFKVTSRSRSYRPQRSSGHTSTTSISRRRHPVFREVRAPRRNRLLFGGVRDLNSVARGSFSNSFQLA